MGANRTTTHAKYCPMREKITTFAKQAQLLLRMRIVITKCYAQNPAMRWLYNTDMI